MLKQSGSKITQGKNSGRNSGRVIYDRPGFLADISQIHKGYRSCAVPGKEWVMQYEIRVEETVIRFNRYTVEVESEEEGDTLINCIADDVEDANHPDDIPCIIEKAGYEITKIVKGAEEASYEIY